MLQKYVRHRAKLHDRFLAMPVLLFILLIAILPNGLEYSLLVFRVDNQYHIVPLYLTILFVLFFPSNRSIYLRFITVFVLYFSVLALSVMQVPQLTLSALLIGLLCYATPFIAAKWAFYIGERDRLMRLYYFSIFLILVIQGLLILLQTQVPFLSDFSYASLGQGHRDSFGTYRYGSTIAAANTSGCLTALVLPVVLSLIVSKRIRIATFICCCLAVLGYQSRSGMLILVFLSIFHFNKKFTFKSLLIAALVIGFGLFLFALRESGEVSSSNEYRWFLATQAINLITQGDLINFLIGFGPGNGVSRDLAAYYGQLPLSSQSILYSSESFLLLSFVEIGLIGMLSLIYFFWINLRDKSLVLAFLIYLALDPSFNRVFDAFLASSLIFGVVGRQAKPTQKTAKQKNSANLVCRMNN